MQLLHLKKLLLTFRCWWQPVKVFDYCRKYLSTGYAPSSNDWTVYAVMFLTLWAVLSRSPFPCPPTTCSTINQFQSSFNIQTRLKELWNWHLGYCRKYLSTGYEPSPQQAGMIFLHMVLLIQRGESARWILELAKYFCRDSFITNCLKKACCWTVVVLYRPSCHQNKNGPWQCFSYSCPIYQLKKIYPDPVSISCSDSHKL